MVNIKYKNWDEVSIGMYKRISEIWKADDEEVNKQIATLAILCDVDEDVIWDMNVPQVQALMSKIGFIYSFDFDKKGKYTKVKTNRFTYKIDTDVSKMTYAQYVDFQQYWHNSDTDLTRMLSVFLIPSGCKYNDGYDMQDVIDDIESNISITKANAIAFFLLKRLVGLTRCLAQTLKIWLKWMKRKMDKDTKKKIEEIQCMFG